MTFRSAAQTQFLRLPPRLRRNALSLMGRRAPWDHRFNFRAPSCPVGLEIGPPDFIGVGVQKAGTTWWFSMIGQHPEVYEHAGYHKERHFFDRFWGDQFGAQDVTEYHRWFPRPPGATTGEWTPDYSLYHWTPPLVKSCAPEGKILLLLRDPVERYRSGMSHHLNNGQRLSPGLSTDAFHRGLYSEQVARYERVFGQEQVLVLQFEACVDSAPEMLRRTFAFLELDDCAMKVDRLQSQNRSVKQFEMSLRQRRDLAALYLKDVTTLAVNHPDLDLDRWRNFSRTR